MNKRLLALLVFPLILAACGGGGGSSTSACKEQFWNGTVGMCLPAEWKVVDRETLTQRGLPDEVILAFQADKAVSGQFPTVTVTRETVHDGVDSPAYSTASIRSVATLPGYRLIDTKKLKLDGQDVELHVFTAQPLSEEPERRFYQISAVSKNIGYTFTALTPLSVSTTLEKEVLAMMESASFIDPSASSKK